MAESRIKELISPFKEVIFKWMDQNNICKTPDKKNNLFWEIFKCMAESELELSDFENIISICSKEDIIIMEGNMWEYLKTHFNENQLDFLKHIFNTCPRGLSSSPNADCGKGELFYRMLRPNSRQPKKGDIKDNGKIIELKGSKIRLFADKSGKQYRKDTEEVFKNSGIVGNYPKKGGLEGKEQYEIEKSQYAKHYGEQFCKDIPKSKDLIKKYLSIHELPYSNVDLEMMFKKKWDPSVLQTIWWWDQSVLQTIWLKKMFPLTMNGADKMIMFGDGTNVKILCDVDDLDKVAVKGDYFRINQNNHIGYYII